MLHRLSRFDIEAWTRHAVVSPSKNSFKKLTKTEVSRKNAISRMYDRDGREHVERFIISGDNIYLAIENSKRGCEILSADENNVYRPICQFDDWSKHQDFIDDFEKKYKRALAVEKLSKETAPVIGDKNFENAQDLRVSISKGDISYDLPTHFEYISIDQRIYIVELDGDGLVPKELDYDQTLYFNNTNSYGSYVNIPKERLYIVTNDDNYHEQGRENYIDIFLDGKSLQDAPMNLTEISLEDFISKFSNKIKENLAKQKISSDKFLDLNDHEVEFYVDKI